MTIGVHMTLSSRSIDVAVLAHKAESPGCESLGLPEHPVIPVHVTTRSQGSSDGASRAIVRLSTTLSAAALTELEPMAAQGLS